MRSCGCDSEDWIGTKRGYGKVGWGSTQNGISFECNEKIKMIKIGGVSRIGPTMQMITLEFWENGIRQTGEIFLSRSKSNSKAEEKLEK